MNEAFMQGEKYTPKGERITEYPAEFKKWVKAHKTDIAKSRNRGTEPYFIRNNSYAIDEILNPKQKELTTLEKAKIRHDARTPEQTAKIQNEWNARRIQNLQKAVNQGLLPKESITGLEQLPQDELNNRIAFLQKRIAAHQSRTQAQINNIKKAWEQRKNALLDRVHPAMKKAYKTTADIDETFKLINAEFSPGEKWFEHGDLKLALETNPRANGSTWMDGRTYLKQDRLDYVKSALGKIGRGKADAITFQEADAMATFWHEITHNRNVPGNMSITNTQRDVMEMMNEFVARKTLPDFYAKMGCKTTPHPEFITNRASTGYNRRVLGYDFVISKLGLDADKVLQSAKKNLFALKYSEQENTAIQALLDGGLDKFKCENGKKIGMLQIKKIVALCRQGYATQSIENYMRNKGIIK